MIVRFLRGGQPRRREKTVVFASAIFSFALLLAGCGYGGALAPVRTSIPTGESVAPGLEAYYHQVLTWSGCGDATECATALVPLDWADPARESISLALARHRATGDDRIGSLLVNPGGPGRSGVDFVTSALTLLVDEKLKSRFDIVGFDPRGVGKSTSVRCYEPKEMDGYLYGVSAEPRGSDARLRDDEARAADFAAACKNRSDHLLPHVNTVSAAKDLDLLRAVLGETKLNYLGFSYGTLLGATFAGLYPANVGRMVLDGALDPALSNLDRMLGQAAGFENALRSYLADCLAKSECPFAGSVDEGMNTVRALLDSVDARPLVNHDGRALSGSTLLMAVVSALYSEATWKRLGEMFKSVMAGDANVAFQLVDHYFGRTPEGQYTGNGTEAFVAITCSDYDFRTDDASRQAFVRQLAAAPILGPYLDSDAIQCRTWPIKRSASPVAIRAEGAAPILVVGTTNDPATPYQWAQNLAGQLVSGHLVTREGEGHLAYNRSNSCVDNAVDDYLLLGVVPASDPHC